MTTTFGVEAATQLVRGLQWMGDAVYHGESVLAWRHHGLGMLQAELSDTLRVHVWHPSLVSPGMAWPRCVHDHRFDLESAVVLGCVVDVLPDVRAIREKELIDLSGQWGRAKVYEIEHAKNQDRMMKGGCTTATSARYLGDVVLTRLYTSRKLRHAELRHARPTGTSYRVERRVFHTTEVESLAVTVVHRSNFDDRLARVLCAPDGDVTAVSGIMRDDSPEHQRLVGSVLREAAAAVSRL